MTKPIRVAIVGVGNCASSLVQGCYYYRESRPGLIHWQIEGYTPEAIEFSAAFDVDESKVGKSLDSAIFSGRNNTYRFVEVPHIDVDVLPAPVIDGVGEKYCERVKTVSGVSEIDVVKVLQSTETDVLVNYLPVGSKRATEWWAEKALEANCAFVNCIPEFIASDPQWHNRFLSAGIPVIGDDVKSQFGATIVHRVLTELMLQLGIQLETTYQLNFGGNMDFYNMLNKERLTGLPLKT